MGLATAMMAFLWITISIAVVTVAMIIYILIKGTKNLYK